jgi:peptidoglycan/xylan/chitin deacetylase (PgdA/CDA1 family)
MAEPGTQIRDTCEAMGGSHLFFVVASPPWRSMIAATYPPGPTRFFTKYFKIFKKHKIKATM